MTAAVGAELRVLPGLGGLDRAHWDGLTGTARVDHSYDYLCFREYMEPGAAFVATAWQDGDLRGALHGACSTPDSALFSHPWKQLSSPQFLREEAQPQEASGPGPVENELHRRLGELTGTPHTPGAPAAGPRELTERLGECLTVRSFDSSEGCLRTGQQQGPAAQRLLERLVGSLQRQVSEGLAGAAGAVAVPYVRPGDQALRAALASCGFRRGVLTGVSTFQLPQQQNFEGHVAGMVKRRRRRFKNELAEFDRSGLRLSTRSLLGADLDRIVELEYRNSVKHGGTPDLARLRQARATMGELLGERLRVPVLELGGEIVGCGIDLFDERSYIGLSYGFDYAHQGAEPWSRVAYPMLAFYEPMRFCLERGLREMRMGFEAFLPKSVRGARVEPRECWIWHPDPTLLAGLGAVLDLFTARSESFFAAHFDLRLPAPDTTVDL
ncbi:GNAT family N-acetyltransferase [Streptacidiphilus jiangxiensis]|uniref:Predicted N-acyltransferase n=1 Tax=Streptacidiphilus jiangxiensis TaxID=235985 RepID=A0A1H7ZKZ2_STRJI|nr:GNAT family N-acetyltransferase [Streptacidiphilus jiangxiensis]SEM58901.1 Predicted N-acyltransferase [Streptacidiphilus jiangxiensis]